MRVPQRLFACTNRLTHRVSVDGVQPRKQARVRYLKNQKRASQKRNPSASVPGGVSSRYDEHLSLRFLSKRQIKQKIVLQAPSEVLKNIRHDTDDSQPRLVAA